MMKFKKAYNFKIISLIINITFLFTYTLYACTVFEDALRVPIGQKNTYEDINRLNRFIVTSEEQAEGRVLSIKEFLELHGDVEAPLVIGATGFIGSHLVDELLTKGGKAIVATRSKDVNKLTNIRHNLRNENLYAVSIGELLDQGNLKALEELIKHTSVIYYMAARVSTRILSFEETVESFSTNSLMTAIICALARKYKTKVIFISSAFVYNQVKDKNVSVNEETPLPITQKTSEWINSTALVFNRYVDDFITDTANKRPIEFIKEELNKIGTTKEELETFLPEGTYAISKILGEKFVRDLKPGHGVVFRLTNVYGPRQKGDNVVPLFIKKLITGENVSVSNDTRNFIYVKDVARLLRVAIETPFEKNETFIVASDGEPVSMHGFLDTILPYFETRTNEQFSIIPEKAALTMPQFDTSKAKKYLGLHTTSLREGIRLTLTGWPEVQHIIDLNRQKKIENFLQSDRKQLFNYERNILMEHWDRVRAIIEENAVVPYEIEIQPESFCNLKCEHCIGKEYRFKHRKYIAEAIMIKIMNEIIAFNKGSPNFKIQRIKFSGFYGEPLVNKKATLIGIRKAIEGGIKVGLFTNGVLMDSEVRENIVKADYVHISLDAGSDMSLSRIKKSKPGDFEKIINNIRELVKLRKQTPGSNLKINVGFILNRENYNEIYNLVRILKEIGIDSVRFKMNILDDPEQKLSENMIEEAYNQIEEAQVDFEASNFRVESIHSQEETEKIPVPDFDRCFFSSLMNAIGADSYLYPCDHRIYENGGRIVDLRVNSFSEGLNIWKTSLSDILPNMCSVCPPMGNRINRFLNFIYNEYKKDPTFLDWIERNYIKPEINKPNRLKQRVSQLCPAFGI